MLQRKYNMDGSTTKTEMRIIKKNKQKRICYKKNNEFGDYYRIDKNGDLNIYDNIGFIKTIPLKK